jgi:hypothetical protein
MGGLFGDEDDDYWAFKMHQTAKRAMGWAPPIKRSNGLRVKI